MLRKRVDFLLIQPPPAGGEPNFEGPSLSLSNLAAFLERKEISLAIKDFFVDRYEENSFLNYLSNLNPMAVGITSFTHNYPQALRLIKAIKGLEMKHPIIMGGPHPTAMPEEVLRDGADYVVKGEGELALWTLINRIREKMSAEDIPGVSFKRNGEVIHNAGPSFIKDLSLLPLPAYHLLPMKRYRVKIFITHYSPPAIIVSASRGCPYKCIFCQRGLLGLKIRERGLDRLFEEIEILCRDYGYRYFAFADEYFRSDRTHLLSFLERMNKFREKRPIFWVCQRRIDATSSLDLFRSMRKAGCLYILFGIETGSSYSNRLIRKGIVLEKVAPTIRLVKWSGIPVVGSSFIIGFPWETKEMIRETISFATSLSLNHLTVNIATPLPGTELWADCLRKGLIDKGIIFEKPFDYLHSLFTTPSFDGDYLEREIRRAHLLFFFKKIIPELVGWPRIFIWRWRLKSGGLGFFLGLPVVGRYIIGHGISSLIRRFIKIINLLR